MNLFLAKKELHALQTAAASLLIDTAKDMSSNRSTDAECSVASQSRTQTGGTGENNNNNNTEPFKEPPKEPPTDPSLIGVNQQAGRYNMDNVGAPGGKTHPFGAFGRKHAFIRCEQHVSDDSNPEDRTEVRCGEHQKQKQKHSSSSYQAKGKKEPSWNNEKGKPSRLPSERFIEPWHIVLGDTHARADRTTEATIFLRNIKQEL